MTHLCFRTAYGPRFRVSQSFNPGLSRVASEFKDESDVNVILRKYSNTGVWSSVARGRPRHGDFSHAPADFMEALTLVNDARDAFMDLPSTLRKRFGNDPAEFVAFCSDEANREEAIRLGLISAPEPLVEAKNASEGSSGTTPAKKAVKPSGGQENPPSVDD